MTDDARLDHRAARAAGEPVGLHGARRPRPNRERLPGPDLAGARDAAAALLAAASTWAMKLWACCARSSGCVPAGRGNRPRRSSPSPAHRAKRAEILRNREGAGCADQAHLAQMLHKSLKTHDRIKPHIARFYLAIVRSCCLLFPPLMPNPRQNPPSRDGLRSPSSWPRTRFARTNRPSDRGAGSADRAPDSGRIVHRIAVGLPLDRQRRCFDPRDEQRRAGPGVRIGGRHVTGAARSPPPMSGASAAT